jgi:predicted nucleotidyltransferase
MVVETVKPLRVVMFGSAARGQLRVGSDLDLMVVMPDGSDWSTTMRALRLAQYAWMRRGVDLPALDLVFATETLLAQHGQSVASVYHPALREGVEVFAA